MSGQRPRDGRFSREAAMTASIAWPFRPALSQGAAGRGFVIGGGLFALAPYPRDRRHMVDRARSSRHAHSATRSSPVARSSRSGITYDKLAGSGVELARLYGNRASIPRRAR